MTQNTKTLAEWWASAESWDSYLARVVKYPELWNGVHERVQLPEDMPSADTLLPCAHLLALAEDWCGDAANSLPVVAHLARHYDVELRVLERDANLDLMDQYLTDGRSRSIPVVIALDCDFNELGWWGPRPSELQEWVMSEGLSMPSDERYKVTRRWYAKDRGASTVREVLSMLRPSEAVTP